MSDKAICEHCGKLIDEKPRVSFLGFQRHTCPSCGKDTMYPLTRGYRLIYRLLLVMALLGFISYAAQGQIAIPGVLGIATIVALVQDYRLRKKVKSAKRQDT